ncbi:MAG: retroviral-like aspartic protease family protein [Tepidanaerobacteraceae bacterium]|jgi:clan AA aspartic protease (TIGR02281 family)|nr:retroviral-like aspartic protease family protein [Tepidanaerobacteraceae bacterium]
MRTRLDIPIVLRRVQINGLASRRETDMILDTGAVYTVIAWDVAKDIGYDPAASERRMPIVTANGVIEAPLITVESIELVELRAEAVDVICHDIPEIAGIEGLLGLSFLKHFRTLVDYLAGILEITRA